MRVIVTNSYDEMSTEAAKIVAGQIYLKPDSVLGLATGSTPLSMYKKLIAVHEMIGLDFSQVTTFNLDEYIGMAPDNPQSYHYFMHHNFFDFINIKPENIYIPDGMAKDIVAEGKRYDALIEAKGGIDLPGQFPLLPDRRRSPPLRHQHGHQDHHAGQKSRTPGQWPQ